jgi:hypothetical protein
MTLDDLEKKELINSFRRCINVIRTNAIFPNYLDHLVSLGNRHLRAVIFRVQIIRGPVKVGQLAIDPWRHIMWNELGQVLAERAPLLTLLNVSSQGHPPVDHFHQICTSRLRHPDRLIHGLNQDQKLIQLTLELMAVSQSRQLSSSLAKVRMCCEICAKSLLGSLHRHQHSVLSTPPSTDCCQERVFLLLEPFLQGSKRGKL